MEYSSNVVCITIWYFLNDKESKKEYSSRKRERHQHCISFYEMNLRITKHLFINAFFLIKLLLVLTGLASSSSSSLRFLTRSNFWLSNLFQRDLCQLPLFFIMVLEIPYSSLSLAMFIRSGMEPTSLKLTRFWEGYHKLLFITCVWNIKDSLNSQLCFAGIIYICTNLLAE